MSLLTIVRSAVKLADKITKPLQPEVTIAPWIGGDGFGSDAYGTPVPYRAIVNQEVKPIFNDVGETVQTKAYVAILQPIPDVVTVPPGQARVNPVDERDLVVLPDGTTGPIVRTTGFIDAGTNRPIFSEIWLGL